jgi:general secretion pathway protein D
VERVIQSLTILAARHVPAGRRAPVLRSGLALSLGLLLLAGCEAPLTVGERGILPKPPPGQEVAQENQTVGAAPHGIRPYEQFGEATKLAATVPTGRTLPVITSSQQVRLDFTDTPIATVASEVIRNVLGMPADIDDTVQGRMTLKTSGAVPVSDVPRLLDQALRPFGYGIALVNGRVRVGRIGDLSGAPGAGQTVTETIPLQHVRAADIIAALQPAATQLQLSPADNGNAITASGPVAAVQALRGMVGLFDTDMLARRSFGIYPLRNASPNSVARELTQTTGSRSGMRFEPIQRLNAVLVVADQPRELVRARGLISHLDVESAATSYIHVYRVVNRRASDIADVLARLFGAPQSGAPAASPAGSFAQLQLGSTTSSNANLGVRVPGMGQNQTQNGAQPPAPQPGDILLGPVDGAAGAANALGLSAPVRIQQDPGRNALVVLASPTDYRIIEQAIRALDVRPRQVLIEAVIAEVRLNQGMQWGLDALYHDSQNTASFQSGAASAFSTLLSGTAATNPLGQGIAYLFHNQNIAVLVKALSTLTNVNIISAPRVLVLDNQTATLQVGDQVPIITQQQQSTDNTNAPVVNNVQMRDTGVILAVTPRIGAGGNMSLDLFQEVSSPTPTTSSKIDSPTISVRRIESTVNLDSGDTIAIGGLMQDQATRTKSGVPWLSDVPFLGWLFGSLNNQSERTELLVLLNPRIAPDEAAATELTDELRAKLNSIAPTLAARTIAPPSPRSVPPPPVPKTPTGTQQFFR